MEIRTAVTGEWPFWRRPCRTLPTSSMGRDPGGNRNRSGRCKCGTGRRLRREDGCRAARRPYGYLNLFDPWRARSLDGAAGRSPELGLERMRPALRRRPRRTTRADARAEIAIPRSPMGRGWKAQRARGDRRPSCGTAPSRDQAELATMSLPSSGVPRRTHVAME